jgi:hypothetical protein
VSLFPGQVRSEFTLKNKGYLAKLEKSFKKSFVSLFPGQVRSEFTLKNKGYLAKLEKSFKKSFKIKK